MKWIKPSGLEIEINDNKETIAYAESLGWKKASDVKVEKKNPEKEKLLIDFDDELGLQSEPQKRGRKRGD